MNIIDKVLCPFEIGPYVVNPIVEEKRFANVVVFWVAGCIVVEASLCEIVDALSDTFGVVDLIVDNSFDSVASADVFCIIVD